MIELTKIKETRKERRRKKKGKRQEWEGKDDREDD